MGQTLVFYFSGHGIINRGKVYLATPEVDPKEPMFIDLSLTDLTDLINYSNSVETYDELECTDADFFNDATIDNKELVKYLRDHKAKNVPCEVTTEEELISKLREKGYKGRIFEKILEHSVFR